MVRRILNTSSSSSWKLRWFATPVSASVTRLAVEDLVAGDVAGGDGGLQAQVLDDLALGLGEGRSPTRATLTIAIGPPAGLIGAASAQPDVVVGLGDRLALQRLLPRRGRAAAAARASLGGEARAARSRATTVPRPAWASSASSVAPARMLTRASRSSSRGEGVADALDGRLQALALALQVLEAEPQPVDALGAVPGASGRRPRPAAAGSAAASRAPVMSAVAQAMIPIGRQGRVERPDLQQ